MSLAAMYRLMAPGLPGVLSEFKERPRMPTTRQPLFREASQNVYYVGARFEDINLK
jgi:hypothetical protein